MMTVHLALTVVASLMTRQLKGTSRIVKQRARRLARERAVAGLLVEERAVWVDLEDERNNDDLGTMKNSYNFMEF